MGHKIDANLQGVYKEERRETSETIIRILIEAERGLRVEGA